MIPASLPAALAAPSTGAIPVASIVLGLCVVALAYALIAIAGLRRRVAELAAAAPARPDPAPPPAPAPPAVPRDELTPELFAVIAAAVRVTLGDTPHRVVSLSPAAQLQADLRSVWSAEGRRHIFQSHRPH